MKYAFGGNPYLFDGAALCDYCLLVAKKLQNKIYELRTKRGLTQEELAEKAGVTRQTIIAIEKGNYTPSVALALSLADIFTTSVEDIFWY